MSRPKIHHYVPQSVLRNFSVDAAGKQVWVYDKETGSSRTEGISTAGGEKYFNHVVVDGKGIDFEGIFDSVDGALPGMLATIISTESVTITTLGDISSVGVRVVREPPFAAGCGETEIQPGSNRRSRRHPVQRQTLGRKQVRFD